LRNATTAADAVKLRSGGIIPGASNETARPARRRRGFFAAAVCAVVLLTAAPLNVSAKIGDIGFVGGITEGTRLPKTTETLLAGAKKPSAQPQAYKEVVALGGKPAVIDGLMTVSGNTAPVPTPSPSPKPAATPKAAAAASQTLPVPTPAATPFPAPPPIQTGSYSVTQSVSPATAAQEDTINRSVTFSVNYRREGDQFIEDWTASRWTETIKAAGQTFTLQPGLSHYDVSVISHRAAGVTYSKADISARAVYMNGDQLTTMEISGQAYGYECAWSSTETHRLDVQVLAPDWQLNYQIRPSVSVNKTLQYSRNEPSAISFEGNYRELMQNQSGLTYDIFVKPARFWDTPAAGSASVSTYNTFEQLPAVDAAYLKGHPAEADIKKLLSMGVIQGEPKFYQPAQAITRGEFVSMLTRAIKLPIDTGYQSASKGKKTAAVPIVFPDVQTDRPDYPYIMAAYNAGLAVGRGQGFFRVDSAIEREEAFAITLRALGLTNLGLDPTPQTSFTDDAKIADWARRDLYAALRIDLIRPDEYGGVNPKGSLTKSEAAALINRLLDYMREGLQLDYTEHIVNYSM
jgi:hypothetical protein